MEKKKKKIWIIGGLVLCLVAVIGITFAFFSTGGTQDTANTFTSGCLNIELTDASSSIKLTNTYPISDVEGVDSTSYNFTIRNTCDTATNYSINLESLNQVSNTLNADYIKVSLSSDTFDNVISKLSTNTKATPELDGAYEAYTLYTASLGANETKTYHLKLWIDYDATVEQAANKTYSSKINVIANPETSVVDTLEAKFTLDDKTLTSSLSNNVTSATYCTTTTNICEPTTPATITNKTYTIELEENENNQMVCTKLNGTSKVICSNGLEVKSETLVNIIEDVYEENQDMLAYDGTADNNLRYIGANPNNYVYFNCDDYNNPSNSTCELWRIIGVFNDNSHGISGEKLVKLIRSDSLGNIAWDSANTNDWSTASLQTTLNGDYLNGSGSYASTGIKNDTTRNMIANVTWKLGGSSTNNDVTASMFYERERGTTVYSGRPTTWQGKIALMYPSDYGYATSGGTTTNRDACLAKELYNWDSSSYSDCKNNDWIFNNAIQWTLTPYSSNSSHVFIVASTGSVIGNDANRSRGVRPSVYLTSNVNISGGDGTVNSPYTLKV